EDYASRRALEVLAACKLEHISLPMLWNPVRGTHFVGFDVAVRFVQADIAVFENHETLTSMNTSFNFCKNHSPATDIKKAGEVLGGLPLKSLVTYGFASAM